MRHTEAAIRVLVLVMAAWVVMATACGKTDEDKGAATMAKPEAKIVVTIAAFAEGQAIPAKFTGEGVDVSPAVAWADVPEGTKELAIIMDDPDAPTSEPWVHWVMYKIPADVKGLAEGAGKPGGAEGVQGANTFGNNGYNGPMPPKGHGVHHYHVKVYALDQGVSLGTGADKGALLAAIKGHVLGMGEVVGTYERK